MKQYNDGSLLKYTIARWYTWWTETSIDWIWLTPDILLEFDTEEYEKYETDNQLNKAIKLR
jgi:carboxyl-terminal processing protease